MCRLHRLALMCDRLALHLPFYPNHQKTDPPWVQSPPGLVSDKIKVPHQACYVCVWGSQQLPECTKPGMDGQRCPASFLVTCSRK